MVLAHTNRYCENGEVTNILHLLLVPSNCLVLNAKSDFFFSDWEENNSQP